MLFRRKVKSGSKIGKKIGFPTINLNIGNFSNHHSPGVYKCEVIIDNSSYIGALYFGPKLSHKGDTLEVYIINYNRHIYCSLLNSDKGIPFIIYFSPSNFFKLSMIENLTH